METMASLSLPSSTMLDNFPKFHRTCEKPGFQIMVFLLPNVFTTVTKP